MLETNSNLVGAALTHQIAANFWPRKQKKGATGNKMSHINGKFWGVNEFPGWIGTIT
jgi:hypothetical protein